MAGEHDDRKWLRSLWDLTAIAQELKPFIWGISMSQTTRRMRGVLGRRMPPQSVDWLELLDIRLWRVDRTRRWTYGNSSTLHQDFGSGSLWLGGVADII
jgi:hypothetical protein